MIVILIIIAFGVILGLLAIAVWVSFLFLKDDAKNIDVYDYEIFEKNQWKKK